MNINNKNTEDILYDASGFLIGRSSTGLKMYIPQKYAADHKAVIAYDDSVKTNHLFNDVIEADKKKIPVLVFENGNGNRQFRHLAQSVEKLNVYDVGGYYFVYNPFRPYSKSDKKALKHNMLQKLKLLDDTGDADIKELYSEALDYALYIYGYPENVLIKNSGKGTFGLHEFKNCYRRALCKNNYTPDRYAQLLDKGISRLQAFIDVNPLLFDSINSISPRELFDGTGVVELGPQISPVFKRKLVKMLLMDLAAYVSGKFPASPDKVQAVIIIEEASMLFGDLKKEKRWISSLLNNFKQRGVQVVIATRDESLDDMLLELCRNKVFLRPHKEVEDYFPDITEPFHTAVYRENPGCGYFLNENILSYPDYFESENVIESVDMEKEEDTVEDWISKRDTLKKISNSYYICRCCYMAYFCAPIFKSYAKFIADRLFYKYEQVLKNINPSDKKALAAIVDELTREIKYNFKAGAVVTIYACSLGQLFRRFTHLEYMLPFIFLCAEDAFPEYPVAGREIPEE